MNDGRTAYVLSGDNDDAEQATTALRAAGYRPVNPAEFGIERADDLFALSLDCDVIVLVPDALKAAAFAAAASSILAAAGQRKAGIMPIDYLVPAWRKKEVAA